MDWLACDCVQLFVSLFCAPSGWGGNDFFFVVIFGRQHELYEVFLLCGLWWFVLLLGFGLFTACFFLKRFCGEFDPGSG